MSSCLGLFSMGGSVPFLLDAIEKLSETRDHHKFPQLYSNVLAIIIHQQPNNSLTNGSINKTLTTERLLERVVWIRIWSDLGAKYIDDIRDIQNAFKIFFLSNLLQLEYHKARDSLLVYLPACSSSLL